MRQWATTRAAARAGSSSDAFLPALFSREGTNVPRDSTHRAFDREGVRRLTFFANCIEKNFRVSRERHRKRPRNCHPERSAPSLSKGAESKDEKAWCNFALVKK